MKQSEQAASRTALEEVIQAFEEVLADERRALGCFDHERLERTTIKKVELTDRLAECTARAKSQADAERVAALVAKLREQQLLLSHARSSLAGILSQCYPAHSVGYLRAEAPKAQAMRVNLRG